MPSFHGTIQDPRGNALAGTVTVTDYYTGASATLYEADYTTTKANPVTADTLGKFDFWIDPGAYTLVIASSSGTQTITRWDAIDKETVTQVSTSTTIAKGATSIEQTSGPITTTVWASPERGDIVEIRNSSGSTNTINGNGKNIEGAATFTIYDDESVKLKYNGTQWGVW